MFAPRRLALGVVALTLVLMGDFVQAQGIKITSGGSIQERFYFRNTHHDRVNSNVKRFTKNYFIPPNARLVGFDKRINHARHLVSSQLHPSPDFHYIRRDGSFTRNIREAAGVRVTVRLRSGSVFDRYEGVLQGSVILRYRDR